MGKHTICLYQLTFKACRTIFLPLSTKNLGEGQPSPRGLESQLVQGITVKTPYQKGGTKRGFLTSETS